jgi:hypothetical protein
MADTVHVKHAFVSTKPDSPDSSLVSSSEWNASELFSGGVQGDTIARDSGSATGASWVSGVRAQSDSDTHTGASPSPALLDIVVTLTGAANILAIPVIVAVTSGGSVCTLSLRENGTPLSGWTAPGNGVANNNPILLVRSAGSYAYTVVATASGAETFTSLNVYFYCQIMGTL